MADVGNPDWKVVCDVEPRPKRITTESKEESLSAPGRADATEHLGNYNVASQPLDEPQPKAVLEADVAHVVAHEESNDEAAYLEEDHKDAYDTKEDEVEPPQAEIGVQLQDFLGFLDA